MRWKMKHFSAARAAELSRDLGLYSIVAGVLAARGFDDPQKARNFINPSLAYDWSDPQKIENLQAIAQRLKVAILANKRICIFGDYDVDGITASAIMSNALSALGNQAQVVLPLRMGEGYGLSAAVLKRILETDSDVLLTVDCGVSGAKEVAQLLDAGIEVLITDHHEASEELPLNVLIADPKLDPKNPAGILAGAGVALKLTALLGILFDKPNLWKSQIDLATLGTIADCMPLVNENRALVSEGVKIINSQPRPGIAAVNDLLNRQGGSDSSGTLSFGLIPRLNAAGRVSDPMISFDLLCSQEPERAGQLANKLESLNNERKQLETVLFNSAVEQIEPLNLDCRAIVAGGDHWHDGVKGIVASRLTRAYQLPAIVFSFEDGLAVGSGRSVGGIDLHAAVSKLSDMLVRFGGHQAAIGLTIEASRMDEFAQRLEATLREIPPEQLLAAEEIDCTIGLEQISLESVEELSILEPFGKDNPEPRFLTTDLILKSARFVGTGNQHISLIVSDGARELQAIWFNTPYHQIEELPSSADVIYTVAVDQWRGSRKIKLTILGIINDDDYGHQEESLEKAGAGQELENLMFLDKQEELNQHIVTLLQNGTVNLRKAQAKCLDTLQQKQSTLAIMATGRGKSLIFHIHATKLALCEKKPSLFIYPLRSLISDQEYYLSNALNELGLACASLTGSTPAHERERIAHDVAENRVHMILTTPEFVLANAKNTQFWQSFGFVVVDEAHHIATSSDNFRPDYTRLERLRSLVPEAVFLGLSATSDKPTTDAITQSLGITQIVVDTSKRTNLSLIDKRNIPDRKPYLTEIVERSSKTLIYASSRGATIELCRELRKALREQAHRIAFYNAALTPEDRRKVETNFRNGELCCVIATSAFGEGVNIPDVRDVILYDMPYSLVDFNQMAGRGGRDGQESFIHLLAQSTDAQKMIEYLDSEDEVAETDLACEVGEAESPIQTASILSNRNEIWQNEHKSSLRHLELFADWLFKSSPHGLLSVIQRPLTPLEEQEARE